MALARRQRRSAEEARTAILDAAEQRLIASGPSGIRLQEVAADVGVSHPTVLHHFGSREALVKAVCERAFAGIRAAVVQAIQRSPVGEGQLAAILNDVLGALTAGGRGRVVTWLALEGFELGEGAVPLSDVVAAAHAARKRQYPKGRSLSKIDTTYTVVLATFSLVAESVLGRAIFEKAGLGDGQSAGQGFRAWLARLLMEHVERSAR